MNYSLRLTESQHSILREHLFPGDGCEAAALLLCGRRIGTERHIFTVQEVALITHAECSVRAPDLITWPTRFVDALLAKAYGREKAIIKVHSHGEGFKFFSLTDDASDRAVFSAVASLIGDGHPHASCIMLPCGELFGRVLGEDGTPIAPINSIIGIGDDITIWEHSTPTDIHPSAERHSQAFGSGTISRLRRLSAAIVGCSGTGSIVAEQLARLGIGKLVLVDPDHIEARNLNRILNSTAEDAAAQTPKVEVLKRAIAALGFQQQVVALQMNLASREAIFEVAQCDLAFGCVDSVEGRHLLNRLATFYLMPYFDVGVRLDADGHGGIDSVAGAVHYIQPGKSSLLSRGVYSLKQVEAEEMKRTNPDLYQAQRAQGYLRGVNEDRPAVISVNMLLAALTVNEFLARLHPFRNQPNGSFAYVPANLCEMSVLPEPEGEVCSLLKRHLGKGDATPLLDMPAIL